MKAPVSIVLVLMCLLTGCVGTKTLPLDSSAVMKMNNSKLTLASRPVPQFSIVRPNDAVAMGVGGAIGGVIAGMNASDRGSTLISEGKIKDPALAIQSELLKELESVLRISVVANKVDPIDYLKDEKIANAYAGTADYLLDVQTVNWSSTYLPFKWGRYRVFYNSKVRIIDLQTKSTISEAYFTWQSPDEYPPPTYEQLFDEDAKVLRELLEMAINDAVRYFKKEMLQVL